MTENALGAVSEERGEWKTLVLGSELAEMEKLPPWVDAVASEAQMPEEARFGAQLCLEEAVSNVIRHGYGNVAGHEVTVGFRTPHTGLYVFEVEDEAAAFDPLKMTELPTVGEQALDALGGQGIRLMRGFASVLEYEATARGNRLRIGFGAV